MASNIDDTQPLEGDTETLNTRNNFVEAKAEITALQNKDTTQDADIAGKEPVITPKNSAFNVNFGTGNGNASRGDHLHSGIYEPVINPKNSGFNLVLGDTAGKVAEGNHTHTGVYEPADSDIQTHINSAHAPSNAEQNVNADWNSSSGDSQILNKPATMTPSAHDHVEAEVTDLDKYTQSEVDTNIGVVQSDLDNHKDHANLHMTADERAAMDTTVSNNAPDALNPFITQDDLVAGGTNGHAILDEGVLQTQRFNLDFAGDGVIVTDNGSDTTIVTIPGGGGGGEANTASNSGIGSGLAQAKNGVDLPFKSLIGGANITLSEQSDTVTITGEAGGGVTNLTYTKSATQGQVNSDTGTDAVLPIADDTDAGLLLPADFTKLGNQSGVNTGDDAVNVNAVGNNDAEAGASSLVNAVIIGRAAYEALAPVATTLYIINGV